MLKRIAYVGAAALLVTGFLLGGDARAQTAPASGSTGYRPIVRLDAGTNGSFAVQIETTLYHGGTTACPGHERQFQLLLAAYQKVGKVSVMWKVASDGTTKCLTTVLAPPS